MPVLGFSRERVLAFLREIDRVKDSDFPYPDSEEALLSIEETVRGWHRSLQSLSTESDPAIVQNACSESLAIVAECLPFLGFILRSTNVRNSFEVFGPLHRLAKLLLGGEVRLILSSEWVHSPHIYARIPQLPNFVLLGLPAFESGNPLLIPLAGHELGHTAWDVQALKGDFDAQVLLFIHSYVKDHPKEYETAFGEVESGDLFLRKNVLPAHLWAMSQIEETFCDCLGVRLFGEAFIHAFAYLLLPWFSDRRVCYYPNMQQRFSNLRQAAEHFGVTLSQDYESCIKQETISSVESAKDEFLLSLADKAASSMVDEVINKASQLADDRQMPGPTPSKIDRALTSFKLLTPASGIGSLVDILNAGWQVYQQADFWKDAPDVPEERRVSTLYEVVLKSIEILEVEERTGQVT